MQLVPENIDALYDALAEGVVDVKNDRGLRLDARGCTQFLDARHCVAHEGRGRRKIAEDLREALLSDLRRRSYVDQEGNFGRFGGLRDRDRAAGVIGADQQRAAFADQSLGDDAAILWLGFGVAVDEFHRGAASLLDDLGAELVALARLLTHEGLHTAEIENDADLDGSGRLRKNRTRQDARAQRAGAGGEKLAAVYGDAFCHDRPLVRGFSRSCDWRMPNVARARPRWPG